MSQNMRHGGQGFDVVDVGGSPEETTLGRERRLGTRIGPTALETVELRGLLAKDVAPGTPVYVQFDVKSGTKDIFPQVARFDRFFNRPLKPLKTIFVRVTQEDVTDLGLQGIGCNRHPLDQLMRVGQ